MTRSDHYDLATAAVLRPCAADWLLTEQIRGSSPRAATYTAPENLQGVQTRPRPSDRREERRGAHAASGAGLELLKQAERLDDESREHALASDLVRRDFNVEGHDRLLVADLTQLTTWQSTCYAGVVAGAYGRSERLDLVEPPVGWLTSATRPQRALRASSDSAACATSKAGGSWSKPPGRPLTRRPASGRTPLLSTRRRRRARHVAGLQGSSSTSTGHHPQS